MRPWLFSFFLLLYSAGLLAQPKEAARLLDAIALGSGKSIALPPGNWHVRAVRDIQGNKAHFETYFLDNLDPKSDLPIVVIKEGYTTGGAYWNSSMYNMVGIMKDRYGTLEGQQLSKISSVRRIEPSGALGVGGGSNLATYDQIRQIVDPARIDGWMDGRLLLGEVRFVSLRNSLSVSIVVRLPEGEKASDFEEQFRNGNLSPRHIALANWIKDAADSIQLSYNEKKPQPALASSPLGIDQNHGTRIAKNPARTAQAASASADAQIALSQTIQRKEEERILLEAQIAEQDKENERILLEIRLAEEERAIRVAATEKQEGLLKEQKRKEVERIAAEVKAKEDDRLFAAAKAKESQRVATEAKARERERLLADAQAEERTKEQARVYAQERALEQERLLAEAKRRQTSDEATGALSKEEQYAKLLVELDQLKADIARRSQKVVWTPGRRALVIGNNKYKHVAPLVNASEDARTMAESLRQVGYGVTLKFDLTQLEMKAVVRAFKGQVGPGDEVAIFYAGHGVQIGQSNFLLPVDITGESEDQIRDDAVLIDRILEDMSEKKAKFTLAIFDACRDSPFKTVTRSVGSRGLAPSNTATGQMVVFSAGSGQQALDKLGDSDKDKNGIFTRIFVKEMQRPGLSIDRVVRNVRTQVVQLAKSVGHEQVPAIYDQVIGEFYFKP